MAFGRQNKPASQEVLPPATKEVIEPKDVAKLADVIGDVKDVTVRNNSTALSTEMAAEFDTGQTGLENVTSRDLIIPRLTILQSMSPQLNERKPEFIDGSKLGQFCDTAIGDVYDELQLLPVYYANIALEWAPRESGKGMIANHGLWNDNFIKNELKAVQNEKRQWMHGDNIVQETATFYCINITAGGRRSFLPLSSTHIKSAKRWLTLITNERLQRSDGTEFQPPIFYRSWKATKTHESNAKGDWFGWKFEPDATIFEIDPSKNLLKEAKEFLEQARAGLVMGDLASYSDDGTAGAANGEGGTTNNEERAM